MNTSACWLPAQRPPRWATCYAWFNESWQHAVIGDFLKYAPVHYAELCPIDREPYRVASRACGDRLTRVDASLARTLLERATA